jgi:DnaJ-class molecular chaperone
MNDFTDKHRTMRRMPDWYALLGVAQDADADALRHAYRRLALKHHPDMGGDTELFMQLKTGYDILADPAARAAYDTARNGSSGTVGTQPRRWARASDSRGGERGEDVYINVDVDQRTAVFGGTVTFQRNRHEPCPVCDGTGSGESRTGQCLRCDGTCRVTRYVTHDVPVEARTADGTELRLPGMGDAGEPGVDSNGTRTTGVGICGALVVRFHPQRGKTFSERGDDLISNETITTYDAVLGVERVIELLDGPATMVVPAGTQPGQRIRIRGRGAPLPGGEGRGDALIEIHVSTVVDLEPQERALFEELRKRHARRAATGGSKPPQ